MEPTLQVIYMLGSRGCLKRLLHVLGTEIKTMAFEFRPSAVSCFSFVFFPAGVVYFVCTKNITPVNLSVKPYSICLHLHARALKHACTIIEPLVLVIKFFNFSCDQENAANMRILCNCCHTDCFWVVRSKKVALASSSHCVLLSPSTLPSSTDRV